MELKNIVSAAENGGGHLVQPLTRQGSLYNLTLEEVQNNLPDVGKPVTSMNVDELIRFVMAAEESLPFQTIQAFRSNVNEPASSSSAALPNINWNLPQKRVDEVWKEIVDNEVGSDHRVGDSSFERQPTLGEMTLEDFLVKGGAINRANQHLLAGAADAKPTNWLQYQSPAPPLAMVGGPGFTVPPAGYGQNHLALPLPTTLPTDPETCLTESPVVGSAARADQRVGDHEILEKTIERRQMRMIKNRESAARSRQRKQVQFYHISYY